MWQQVSATGKLRLVPESIFYKHLKMQSRSNSSRNLLSSQQMTNVKNAFQMPVSVLCNVNFVFGENSVVKK